MFRISIGLTCLVLSTLFVASAFGLIPDAEQATLEGRKRWTETVSLDCAFALQRKDEAFLKAYLPLLLQREPSLASIGLRAEGGQLLYEGGDHGSMPNQETRSTDKVSIPLILQDKRWGNVEFRFKPRTGFLGIMPGSFLLLALFFGMTTLAGISIYLHVGLRHGRRQDGAAERVRAMLDTVAEGVLVLDREQRIVLANRSFAKRFGAECDELSGRKVEDLPWLTRDQAAPNFPWTKTLDQNTTEIGSMLTLQSRSEGPLKFSVNATPVLGENGECKGALTTFDDLTPIETRNAELRQANHRLKVSEKKIRHQAKDLKSAKAVAEAANKAKSEFLANVSHEIRTPMNTILGMTDVALEMEMPGEQRECFEMVKTAGDNLLDLINELLDLSKIEAGKFTLEAIPFQLTRTITDTVRLFEAKAHRQGVELLCDLAADLPDGLLGDPGRLRQVIINLIGNALKFTSQGQVQLRVAPAQEQTVQGKVALHFQVQDTGIGIPDDKREAIFQPFVQADGSTTRKYGGTGLGLTICAELVQRMGGHIWVESQLGTGSTFHFVACFEADSEAKEMSSCPPSLARVPRGKVLLVEGNTDARNIAAGLLSRWHFPVCAVSDGHQAIQSLEEGEGSQEPFALVMIATQLPDMDGFDLARMVKACCSSHTRIVMMLTGAQRKKDQERCMEINVEGALVKPVLPDNLSRTLTKVYRVGDEDNHSERRPTASSPGFAPQIPPLRILFVDDNSFNQRVGDMKLSPKGHTVHLASSGRETLEVLARETFDLLLLDMQMPDMDGLEVTRHIRQRETGTGRHLPIVAVTAHSQEEVRRQCLDAGMDGYVAKPIKDEDLWRAIQGALDSRKKAIAADAESGNGKERQSDSQSHVPLNSPATGERGSKNRFQVEAILARVGGNQSVLNDLVGIFRNDSVSLLAQIGEGLRQGEPKKVETSAHSLKGMLGFFDVVDGVEHARALEALGKEAALEGGKARLDQLIQVNERVLADLKAMCPY